MGDYVMGGIGYSPDFRSQPEPRKFEIAGPVEHARAQMNVVADARAVSGGERGARLEFAQLRVRTAPPGSDTDKALCEAFRLGAALGDEERARTAGVRDEVAASGRTSKLVTSILPQMPTPKRSG